MRNLVDLTKQWSNAVNDAAEATSLTSFRCPTKIGGEPTFGLAAGTLYFIIIGFTATLFTVFGIEGFSALELVLFIGILTTLFSALMGSRALIQLVYGRRRRLERLAV